MTEIAIGVTGVTGHMGRMLVRQVLETPGTRLAGGTVRAGSDAAGRDIGTLCQAEPLGQAAGTDPHELFAASDAVIDFTLPEAVAGHAEAAAATGTAWIVGTTGLESGQEAALDAAAAHAPVVFAPNMSLGVNLLFVLAEQVAGALDDSFDIEIVEMHHNRKVDAPSGTALGLGQAAARGRGIGFEGAAVLSREGRTDPRRRGDIGFAALRGGDVVRRAHRHLRRRRRAGGNRAQGGGAAHLRRRRRHGGPVGVRSARRALQHDRRARPQRAVADGTTRTWRSAPASERATSSLSAEARKLPSSSERPCERSNSRARRRAMNSTRVQYGCMTVWRAGPRPSLARISSERRVSLICSDRRAESTLHLRARQITRMSRPQNPITGPRAHQRKPGPDGRAGPDQDRDQDRHAGPRQAAVRQQHPVEQHRFARRLAVGLSVHRGTIIWPLQAVKRAGSARGG